MVIWTINGSKPSISVLGKCESVSQPLIFENESVTAVAFAPEMILNRYLVAIGLDSGLIFLYSWFVDEWKQELFLSQR